jgi:FkbM family methyltransferase
MEFSVPNQVAPALVVFSGLIDPEFALLERLARPDWVVVDVGAAIGQFSVFAARLPVAVVHAYEPSGPNLATLRRNIARNGLDDRVRVHCVALSDHDGEACFETMDNAYMSRLSESVDAASAHQVVPVRTLADEAETLGLRHISVLKVNVAGYEPQVLAGAAPLLSGGRVDILILLIGRQSEPWYERCSGWGYDFFFFHPREGALHRVESFDSATLDDPPWPARHLIGVRKDALDDDLLSQIRVVGSERSVGA